VERRLYPCFLDELSRPGTSYGPLPPGRHELRVERYDGAVWTGAVELRGEPEVEISLKRAP
jgi:hypothetical protein